MKAVIKFRWKIASAVIVAACFILPWQCSSPVNKPPLRWQSVIDVPLTSDSFFLGKEMSNLFTQIDTQKIDVLGTGRSKKDTGIYYSILKPDSTYADTVKGDTVVFSILRHDTVTYETHEDSMKAQDFHPRLGSFQISNAPAYSAAFSVPADTFTASSYPSLTGITAVIFDSSSPPMTVTITNNSAATITNLNISMLGNNQLVTSLGPNASIPLTISVARQGFANGIVPITIRGTASAADNITFSFNFNGLLASYAQIMSNLVSFSKVVTNDYNLTDTLNVDYIDIKDGGFLYIFHNYTQIYLQVTVDHLHLWGTTYSINNSLMSVDSLDSMNARGIRLDSTYYWGRPFYLPPIGPGSMVDSQSQNMANLRLFPIWNPTIRPTGESVSRVLYTVSPSPNPNGPSMVTLSAADSMLFTIRAPTFRFQQMKGTVVLPYVRAGDTAKVAVPFPWNPASKDSLRGRFILKNVWADIFLTPILPPTAYITNLGVHDSVFNPDSSSVKVIGTDTLDTAINAERKRLYPIRIDTILNQFPDSMLVVLGIAVPVGSHVLAVNQDTVATLNYSRYMGQMFIKADVTSRLNALLSWKVDSSTSLDLGTGRFKVPKATRYISKMDGLLATVHMNTFNFTNVYLNLYALMASKARMNALDSLPLDSVWAYIGDTGRAHAAGYIDLLGTKGVQIPARDSTAIDTVVLNDWQIDSVLQSDSAGWRWEARFLPMNHDDALIDTDYVKIRSWMHLVGNNNMDSLLIWH